MAAKRRSTDDPGQGDLFALKPEIKPLVSGARGGSISRQSRTRERATGERFVPPVNWIEDEHERTDSDS